MLIYSFKVTHTHIGRTEEVRHIPVAERASVIHLNCVFLC